MEICDSQNSVIFYNMTDVFEWGNTPMLPNAAPNTEEYTAGDWAGYIFKCYTIQIRRAPVL